MAESFWERMIMILVIIEVIPTTIPAIAGVRKCICDSIELVTSESKSFSRSSTRFISLMYSDTLINACDATSGPFLEDSINYIEKYNTDTRYCISDARHCRTDSLIIHTV